MQTRVLKFILLFLLVIVMFSCSSPADLDTPTKTTPLDRSQVLVKPKVSQITMEQNGTVTEFEVEKYKIVVDTLETTARIWLNLSAKVKEREHHRRFGIKSFVINVDSFPVGELPFNFYNNTTYRNCWIKFLLNRGERSKFDTLVDASSAPNYFELSFMHKRSYREFWGNGYAKIYGKRFTVAERDTIVKDSVLKVRYDTVYIDNKMVIKKEEYWDVREIKMKVEETTPFPDSLFINLKIRMKY